VQGSGGFHAPDYLADNDCPMIEMQWLRNAERFSRCVSPHPTGSVFAVLCNAFSVTGCVGIDNPRCAARPWAVVCNAFGIKKANGPLRNARAPSGNVLIVPRSDLTRSVRNTMVRCTAPYKPICSTSVAQLRRPRRSGRIASLQKLLDQEGASFALPLL